MTALTPKQRTKVNAALCIIHDFGHNAQTVVDAASAMIAKGQAATTAYEMALNTFATGNPDMGAPLSRITRLIEASSPGTVQQYDAALSRYIETGDNTAMVALAPTIAADSVALAIHNGEMTEADIAHGGLALALGYEPSAAMANAFDASAPPSGSNPAPAQPQADSTASQISSTEGPGMLGPKAQAQATRAHYEGFAPGIRALNDRSMEAAREAGA